MSSDVAELIERAGRIVAQRARSDDAAHELAVADAAARLAANYGVDPSLARLAGLLHDLAKSMSDDEILAEAYRRGIRVTEVDVTVPYLLHGPVGAARAAEMLPGLPPEVVSAVSRHTLGAPDMTPLEMVVFVADMIEEGRDFGGVDELRSLAGSVPLEELYLSAYVSSLAHVVAVRHHLHPDTIAAYNAALDAAAEAGR